MDSSPAYVTLSSSPLGEMFLALDDQGAAVCVAFLDPAGAAPLVNALERAGFKPTWDAKACAGLAREVEAYFEGRLNRFSTPVRFAWGTPFQKKVWEQLLRIPYGDTLSYAQLARRIGQPEAVRAVGGANRENPITLLVPCHRVIGSSGALTGYASGLERKRSLLRLEQGIDERGLPLFTPRAPSRPSVSAP